MPEDPKMPELVCWLVAGWLVAGWLEDGWLDVNDGTPKGSYSAETPKLKMIKS
jgi:hypothetical protein